MLNKEGLQITEEMPTREGLPILEEIPNKCECPMWDLYHQCCMKDRMEEARQGLLDGEQELIRKYGKFSKLSEDTKEIVDACFDDMP